MKSIILITVLLLPSQVSSFVYAQTKLKPHSVCNLLQNKQKYKGKEVLIDADLEIAPETSTFRFEETCSVVESLTVGTHVSFQSNDKFEKAIDLLSLQQEGEEKLGISL